MVNDVKVKVRGEEKPDPTRIFELPGRVEFKKGKVKVKGEEGDGDSVEDEWQNRWDRGSYQRSEQHHGIQKLNSSLAHKYLKRISFFLQM